MKKICVVTGSRAEYGLMSRLMHLIDAETSWQLQIIATNTHLSPEFGLTYREIEADGFTIDRKVEMLLSSDTANGTVSGREKITLEAFAQMMFFDRILNRANVRLMRMTSGQYELIRRREAGDLRRQTGLELDVVDHYNGTTRSVQTLSGGESFQASLSLPLGLSAEIQSSSGGIQLDAMFVDEGFGSLDEDALEKAVNALADLAEGDRLVGIISHVAELKARIDRQIVVTKKPTGGSAVRVEC